MKPEIVGWIGIGLIIGMFIGAMAYHLSIEEKIITIESQHHIQMKGMYPITKANMTCDDFSGAELISIQTFNKTICQEKGHMYVYTTNGFCYIPIKMDWEINKQYCNFQIGDNVYVYR